MRRAVGAEGRGGGEGKRVCEREGITVRVLAVAGAGVVGDLVDVRKKPVNLLHVSALELGAGRALQRWANGLLVRL